MIVWLASYPRSGNTYFRVLLNHFYGLKSYSIYKEKRLAKQFKFHDLTELALDHESLAEMARNSELYFIKTHELPQNNSPAIYLVRDGRDALVSYAWYILNFESGRTNFNDVLLNLIVNSDFFGGWSSHVLKWGQRKAPTAIVRFEDLTRTSDPSDIIKQALNEINCQTYEKRTTIGPLPVFEELHQFSPQFFRKGQIGSWKTEMSSEYHDLFWLIHGEAMRQMGYSSEGHKSQLSVLPYWNVYYLRPFLKCYLPYPIQKVARHIRKWFLPKLGQLHQYSAIPLKISHMSSHNSSISMKPLPPVSIVTPSFNQSRFLERTILSVLKQNYSNVEYVSQDGASTDETNLILQKYFQKITHINSCKDTGQANAINQGFQHTVGEIMAWLNSDDLLLPGTISYVANYFLEHPEVDVVYGHRIVIDENDAEVGRWVLPPHDGKMLLWTDYIPQETLFWRRSIWEKAGGYVDESFHFALDWELLLRFREAGAKFVRLPRFLAAFQSPPTTKNVPRIRGQGLPGDGSFATPNSWTRCFKSGGLISSSPLSP